MHPFLDRLDAAFTADTAVLVAAERRRRAAEPIGVYPDSAGLQPFGGAKGATDVRSPHARRQTVGCVIRDLKGFLFGVEGDDRQYRTEDFFACYAHLIVHPGEYGGRDETAAAGAGTRIGPAAEHAARPFASGNVDVLQNLLVLRRGRDGSDMGLRLHPNRHRRRRYSAICRPSPTPRV